MMENHHETQSRGPQTEITSVVFTAIAGIAIILRLYTRLGIVRNFGPEDYLIVAAMVTSIALTVFVGLEVRHGEGHHIDTIALPELTALLKAFYGSLIAYQSALTLTKLSILFQFYRVFVGKKIRLAIWIMVGITTVYGLWSVLSNAFLCSPVSFFWDLEIKGGHCMSEMGVWFANASLNIITDLMIFALPMPALKQLQLPRGQKIGLMGVFALGGFVCLVSIIRLHSLYIVSVSKDVTWDNGPAAYWSSVEVNVGIICACLPTLKAFMSRFFPKLLGVNSSSNNGGVGSTTRGTSGFRKSMFGNNGVPTMNRSMLRSQRGGGDAMGDLEMQKGLTTMDEGNKIQVITVVAQELEELREDDDDKSSTHEIGEAGGARHGVQTVVGTNIV